MRELYQKYALHLDNLRIQAGIRTIDFVANICDDRTYRRYLSGESIMSQEKLNNFCLKLSFSTDEFIRSYNLSDLDEYSLVIDLYFAIQISDWVKCRMIMNTLDTTTFVNSSAKKIYQYCIVAYNYGTKKITINNAFDKYTSLIDYPNCLKKTYFDILDVLSLYEIANIEFNINKYSSLDFLYKLLLDKKYIYVSSDSKNILPSIYSLVARIYGKRNLIEECKSISIKGVEYCIQNHCFYGLDDLYYFLSLSQFKLGEIKLSKKSARLCLSTLIAQDDISRFEEVIRIMKEDFGNDPFEYLHIGSTEELR